MNAHRSLQRSDVTKYPADRIALMVASEFLRAASRSQYPQIVQACLERARELMGILETIELKSDVAAALRPYYYRYTDERLRVAEGSPQRIQEFSQDLARAFEAASEELKHA